MKSPGFAFIGILLAATSSCGEGVAPPDSGSAGATAPAEPTPIMVQVNPDGGILFDGTAISREDLEVRFGAIASMEPQPQVMLAPDAGARFEDVAFVMTAAQRTGVVRKFGVIGGT
jgi:biopolymer transport protein ExbD